jgi:DNA invertase Pin-like site-specific DNA recombinase
MTDMPKVGKTRGPFVLRQMAAVAGIESDLQSTRVRAGLAAAKKRGVKLGRHGAVLGRKRKAEAKKRAKKLAPLIFKLWQRGYMLRIAEELERRQVPAMRGGRW